MKRILTGALLVWCYALSALADDAKQFIGSWLVISKEDRFGDGGTFFAMTGDGAGAFLAIRCIERELSVGVSPGGDKLDPGSAFQLKIRTDKEPVQVSKGTAINDTLIQVVTTNDMVRTIRMGRETAVRVENAIGVSRTAVFRTWQNDRALARIIKECRIE